MNIIRFLKGMLLFLCFFAGNAQVPLPTTAQMAWQQAEFGVVFHYDLHVFDGEKYNQTNNRIVPVKDYNIFAPSRLNTDQWVASAKAAGATFAILTATHETGFALYQSDVNPYCLKALKWRNGKGDLVRDFVNSCRRYGLKPGIYVGIRWNAFLGIHDFKVAGDDLFAKNRQAAYKRMCEGMVEELTTRYGDLFMIWFDGGASDPKTYGADVLPIVEKNQPGCLFYHNAQRADFRWGGSESGTVPYPCWSTYPFPFSHAKNTDSVFSNNKRLLKEGDEHGNYYMPAMSDAPLRGYNGRHEWFWEPGDTAHIYPVQELVAMYCNSVGHNSTLILGLTPNPAGLLDHQDVDTLTAFGKKIKELFGTPLAIAQKKDQQIVYLDIPDGKTPAYLVMEEELAKGQRVRAFEIQTFRNHKWQTLFSGSAIGHKFIYRLTSRPGSRRFRLKITHSAGPPAIQLFAAY
ncbi:alpha-L-fucosidase [Niabella hirudinis]|uniref:alpha-L-fucosidase n=1 Tax=Niabella hirudinis TaxID=1285929 RepID=UPI003EBD5FFF